MDRAQRWVEEAKLGVLGHVEPLPVRLSLVLLHVSRHGTGSLTLVTGAGKAGWGGQSLLLPRGECLSFHRVLPRVRWRSGPPVSPLVGGPAPSCLASNRTGTPFPAQSLSC